MQHQLSSKPQKIFPIFIFCYLGYCPSEMRTALPSIKESSRNTEFLKNLSSSSLLRDIYRFKQPTLSLSVAGQSSYSSDFSQVPQHTTQSLLPQSAVTICPKTLLKASECLSPVIWWDREPRHATGIWFHPNLNPSLPQDIHLQPWSREPHAVPLLCNMKHLPWNPLQHFSCGTRYSQGLPFSMLVDTHPGNPLQGILGHTFHAAEHGNPMGFLVCSWRCAHRVEARRSRPLSCRIRPQKHGGRETRRCILAQLIPQQK